MGYYTRVTGEISIEPPLTWAEVQQHINFATTANYNVRLHLDEETVDTDEGQLIRKTAAAIVPVTDDSFKAYQLVEHVQQFMNEYPSHTFTGRLECEGEEAGDLWRVVIRDGRAVKVEPRIVWPED